METPFSLRMLVPEDGAAYAALLANSPDTGSIQAVGHFEIDPYQAVLFAHRDTVGVVAECAGVNGIVGTCLVGFGQCRWEGRIRSAALINALAVHGDFRRRGLASKMVEWCEDFARKRFGDEGVIWAVIQRKNIGSEMTAKKRATQFLPNRIAIAPLKMRSAPPPVSRPYSIRPVEPADMESVVSKMNLFYRDYNLYAPETPDGFARWLAETPFETPFRHHWVVVDGAGMIVGGLSIVEYCRLRTVVIKRMPKALVWVNQLVQVVPPSGIIRELMLSRMWYVPGREDAAHYLFEALRWECRDMGTSLTIYLDAKSPLMRICGIHAWTMKMIGSLAVDAPVAYSERRLCYYYYD